MSENVIEQITGKWMQEANELNADYNRTGDLEFLTLSGRLDDAADELQAATRPEQFMPPLNCWPIEAQWCAIGPEGAAFYYTEDSEPALQYLRLGACWRGRFVYGDDGVGSIPLGIDWRTLKVSRSDMERWEAE